MFPRRNRPLRRRRALIAASALRAAAGIACCGFASAAAHAQQLPIVRYDLRVHGTDAKEATIYRLSDAIQLDLYATVIGLDEDPSNDRISIGAGYFRSSTGGQLGNLAGLTPPSPFNLTGATNGTARDYDSDGDLDIGASDSDAGNYAFRAFPPPDTQPPEGLFVGRVRFTPKTAILNNSTEVSFRATPFLNILVWPDGAPTPPAVGINDNHKVQFDYGAPVIIRGNPNVDPGPVTFLSGTIANHSTISSHVSAPTGTTLAYTTGVDVVPGGTLDSPAGTVRVNVNDAISGNAGGTMYLNGVSIATTADGTFTQSAGFLRSTVNVGVGSGLHGTYLVTGGTFEGKVSVGAIDAGDGSPPAAGTFRQTGGSSSLTGFSVNSDSSAEVAGGTFAVSANAFLGISGHGTFIQSGGTSDITGTLFVGGALGGGSVGTLDVRGGTLTAFRAYVGDVAGYSDGNVRQSGGTFSPGYITIGSSDPAHPAIYDLADGTFRPGQFQLAANGFINQSGGSVSTLGPLFTIQNNGASASQYVLSGGTFGGTSIAIDHTNTAPFPATGRRGGLVQSGGAVNADEINIHTTGTYDALGGSMNPRKQFNLYGTLDFANSTASLNLADNCFGAFVGGKILNATNATFTGGVGSVMEFAAGFDPLARIGHIQTLGIVHVAGQPLTIPPDKSVGGSGTITGDVTNDGLVAPGNSPGAITINGNYSQGSSAALMMELAGTASGKFDALTITGNASLAGTLNLALLDGFVPSASDQFTILTAATLSGGFANVLGGHVSFAGGQFDVNYSPTGVTLSNFQAVPEPAAVCGVVIVAGSVLMRRRPLERRRPLR